MNKRIILILRILISFTYLAGDWPIYVHVAEDLPHGFLEGIVNAQHCGAVWEYPQDYDIPRTYTFSDPSIYNMNGTSQAIVDVWNFNHSYFDSATAPTIPSGTHIYLHIDKSVGPDPGIPGQH